MDGKDADYRSIITEMVALVDAAVEEARGKEREACAVVCDEVAVDEIGKWHGPEDYRRGASDCAENIRARGTP